MTEFHRYAVMGTFAHRLTPHRAVTVPPTVPFLALDSFDAMIAGIRKLQETAEAYVGDLIEVRLIDLGVVAGGDEDDGSTTQNDRPAEGCAPAPG